MTDNQITEAVKRFLTNPLYNYALMIDGPWGCGKTHYIKEALIPELKKKKYKTTYFSLYGIRNAYDITDAVYSRILSEMVEKKLPTGAKKVIEGTSILAKAAARWGMKKLEFGTEGDIENIGKLIPSMKNRVIIFDDLERCNCSIFEALGQINAFVEHSDARVILVANEAEIGSNSDSNRELQMMVALNKELQVDIPQTVQESFLSSAGSKGKPSLTPEYVDRKRQAIFQGNDEYKRIREKIVGQTIRYEPELKKVFTSILTSLQSDTVLLKICGEVIDPLVEYAISDGHPNIRTFLFFLEKCRMILETLGDRWPETYKEIILYCYRSCIRYMSGKAMPIWEADMGTQEFNDKSSLSNMMWGFRFVDDLITRNSITVNNVCDVVERRAKQLSEEGKMEGDPYALLLYCWNTAEDEEVLGWMKQLNDNIKVNRYSPILYPRIINYAATFHQKKIFSDISEEIIVSMKGSIQRMEAMKLKDFHNEQFMLHDESAVLYHKYAKEIQDEVKKRLEAEEDNDSVLVQDDYENWGSKLKDSLKYKTYISGHSFIYHNDPEVLLELIKKSNNQQLELFRQALMMVYGNRIYYEKIADDYDHLVKLKELVNQIQDSEVGAIKSFVIGWLRENLRKYCDQVHAELEET